MSTKFTPGPWSYSEVSWDGGLYIKPSGHDVVLAEIWGLEYPFPDADDEARANAALIAAAPELLEALEKTVELAWRDHVSDEEQAICESADFLIAKVKGKNHE
jgi:hypothetical protein